jgi:hypothetical protein
VIHGGTARHRYSAQAVPRADCLFRDMRSRQPGHHPRRRHRGPQRRRLLAVGGLGEHVDTRRLEDEPEAAPHQRLVVRDHHGHWVRTVEAAAIVRDHAAAGHDAIPAGMTARTCQPPPGRGPAKGIIITTSGYTSDAHQEVARLGIELFDGQHLLWLLRYHLRREHTIIDPERRKPPVRKPPRRSELS